MRFFSFLFIVLLNIWMSSSADAQEQKSKDEKPSIKDRFVFGGSLGAQFGTYTSVLVSPMVGFYATPRLLAGTGLYYQYYHEKWMGSSISSHIFGSSIWTDYAIIDNIGKSLKVKSDFDIIGHLEYELLNLDRDFNTMDKTNRFWLHGILVGGGIKQDFGKNSSINLVILYNILWEDRTPYTNPVIRLGIYL